MIRITTRVAALLTLVVLMCLTDAFLTQRENALPQGAESAVILDFSDSPTAKQTAIEALDRISAENGLQLAKVAADKGDFLHGKNLYVFGADSGSYPVELAWYDKTKHGVLESSSQLGDVDLNGLYVFRDGAGGSDALGAWARENAVTETEVDTRAWTLLAFTLLSSGYGVALVCSAILLMVAAMGWSALSAHGKALRVVDGQSRWAIVGADIRSYLRHTAPVLVGGYLVGLLVVGLARGDHAVTGFLGASVPFLLGYLVLLAVVFVAMTVIAVPTAEVIARRSTGIVAYRSLSEVLKLVAIALAAMSLPVFTSAAMTSLGSTTNASYWKVFSDDVSLRLLTGSEEDYQKTEPALAQLVDRSEAAQEVHLNYQVTLPADAGTGFDFDGVVLANTAYLEQVRQELGTEFEPVSADAATHGLPAGFAENLSLWCAQTCAVEDFQLLTTGSGAVLPALSDAGDEDLNLLRHPLVLTTEDLTDTYRPDFIGPLLTSGNIVFVSGDHVSQRIDELGLGRVVLSIDRVSDTGLQQGQGDYERAWAQLVGLVVLLMALVLSSAIAAQVHVSTIARRIFVSRSAGMSWPRLLQRRLGYETAAVCTCAVLGFLACAIQGMEYSWAAFATPVLYLAISYPAHVLAARASFDRTVLRKA